MSAIFPPSTFVDSVSAQTPHKQTSLRHFPVAEANPLPLAMRRLRPSEYRGLNAKTRLGGRC